MGCAFEVLWKTWFTCSKRPLWKVVEPFDLTENELFHCALADKAIVRVSLHMLNLDNPFVLELPEPSPDVLGRVVGLRRDNPLKIPASYPALRKVPFEKAGEPLFQRMFAG